MKNYDLVGFYSNLKKKFSKSSADEIFKYMLEELKEVISLEDIASIIFISNELASYLRVKADTKNAYRIYEIISNLTIKEYGCCSSEYATILLNLADVDIVDKNYKLALERLNECENILKNRKNKYLLATMYNNRSSANRALQNYKNAKDDIQNAMKIIEDKNKIAISMINLAEINLAEENFDEALENIKSALEYYILENNEDIHFANALSTTANIYYKLKNYDKSISFYKMAYDKFFKKFGECEITDLLKRNIRSVEVEKEKI